jgi:hypothetical protein
VVGFAPRAPVDSVRPRRLSGVVVRPLNFTVRRQPRKIQRAVTSPIRQTIQKDGRIRRWCQVPEMDSRYLRVILLPDGETIHNAFFDRDFLP